MCLYCRRIRTVLRKTIKTLLKSRITVCPTIGLTPIFRFASLAEDGQQPLDIQFYELTDEDFRAVGMFGTRCTYVYTLAKILRN